MNSLAIVLLSTSIITTFMTIFLVLFLIRKNNLKRLKSIHSLTAGTSSKILEHRMKVALRKNANDEQIIEEIGNIKERITSLLSVGQRSIERDVKVLAKEMSSFFYLNRKETEHQLSKLNIKVQAYVTEALKIKFKLNELVVSNAVVTVSKNSMMDSFKDVRKNIVASKHLEIRSSKPYLESVKNIETNIKTVWDLIEATKVDLAKDKILDTLILIEKLRAEGIKANKYLDIVKFEFKTKVHELGKQIDKNQLPLTKIKGDLLNELNSIDGTYLTIATHVSSNNLMKAESILQTVDKRLTSLYKKTMVQVDSYRILNRTYDKVNAFMREFDVMNDRFVTELLKYNYESKQESIDKITINAKQVKNFYSDFKKTKLETLKIHTPTEILFALSKVIEKYKQYSTYLEKNIDKVDVIINLSNEFNSKLALLNTALLNCEYKLNKLPNTFEIKYKSNLEYSLSKTNGLIHLYKNTNVKPTTKHIEELKILVREIENIERRISTDLFFNELVKTLILILNRYRIESKIIEKYLVDVELLYHNGDLPEALRMIYNISLSNNLNE